MGGDGRSVPETHRDDTLRRTFDVVTRTPRVLYNCVGQESRKEPWRVDQNFPEEEVPDVAETRRRVAWLNSPPETTPVVDEGPVVPPGTYGVVEGVGYLNLQEGRGGVHWDLRTTVGVRRR